MPFKEVSSILVDTKDSYSNNPCELYQLLIGYTNNNTVVQYNEKQKFQARKRLNNVLTTSRHHFDIMYFTLELASRVSYI